MQIQSTRAVLLCALVFGPMTVHADPTEFDGRFYEVIVAPEISWDTSNAAASAKTFNGIQGHLATITSLEEDQFIESLRAPAVDPAKPEVWIGGFQEDGAHEPAQGWMWVNGEEIAPINTPSPYTNWQVNEPNDLGGESHLGAGLGGMFGWNDEQARGNIGGYVVEYGDEVEATSCQGSGCSPSGPVQTIMLPDSAEIPPEATLAQNAITVLDPRVAAGKCGRRPLVLFADDPDLPKLKIPKFFCAASESGEFVVLVTESSGFDILDGTVEVENEPGAFFPDPLPCNIPIPQGVDLQDQDVAIWQPTNFRKIKERRAIDVSIGCGSSRGLTRGLSYFVVGMQYAFGIDYTSNPEAVEQKFIRHTENRLRFLKKAVLKARPVLKRRDFRKLLWTVNKAIWLFRRGDYETALGKMLTFQQKIENAQFRSRRNFNHFGNLQMRVSNAIYLTEVKVIPFAP